MALAKYNKLPPRPEYITKVTAALGEIGEMTIKDLINQTGLSRTQVACTLDALIAEGQVELQKANKTFSLIPTASRPQ